MKKIILFITLALLLTQVHAQYKKASIFTRSGTYYELGGTKRMLKEGRSGATGFYISAGSGGARMYYALDFQVVTPVSFAYTSSEGYYGGGGTPGNVQVSGKGKINFYTGFQLGYFFTDNTNDDVKLLPFLNIGAGYLFGSREVPYTTTPDSKYPPQIPLATVPGAVFGAGGGLLYKVTTAIGISGAFSYNGVAVSGYDAATTYLVLNSHPSVSVGIRLMLGGNN